MNDEPIACIKDEFVREWNMMYVNWRFAYGKRLSNLFIALLNLYFSSELMSGYLFGFVSILFLMLSQVKFYDLHC